MATIDVPTPAQRERAIRVLWLAHEFDTATIAALLGTREAEVAKVVAKREADVREAGETDPGLSLAAFYANAREVRR